MNEHNRAFLQAVAALITRIKVGVVLAAGRYISTPNFQKELPAGLGTRHQAAAAITQATKAIAIAISESTGTVRAFRRGEIFLELEKTAE